MMVADVEGVSARLSPTRNTQVMQLERVQLGSISRGELPPHFVVLEVCFAYPDEVSADYL